MAVATRQLVGWGIRLYRSLQVPPIRQADLAARTGLTQSKVSRIEGGQADVTLSDLVVIAAALRVSPIWLVELPAHLVETRLERGGWREVEQAFPECLFGPPDLRRARAAFRGVPYDSRGPVRSDLSPAKAALRERAERVLSARGQ